MSEIINTLKKNEKHLLGSVLMIAVLIAAGFHMAFSSEGPSQAVVDRMEIGKQDGLRDDLVASASGSIKIKVDEILKLELEVRNLDRCLYQISQEMGTKTQSKTCSQRDYVLDDASNIEGSGSTQTGVTLNPGTEATPVPAVEQKPQA